jgi:threonine dehydratase
MIGIAEVEDAARRLAGIVVRTPLIGNAELDTAAGGRVLLKPECFQSIGSFKIRGAYNLMARLSAEQARRGIVAFSSGNHAQGVALAGRLLGIHAAIVMPADAPRAKLEATRALGGEIVTYDREREDREAIARRLAVERGAEVVPSYDHPHIVAGQGTVGLEIAEQASEAGLHVDQALIPCSGGGLSSGCAVALKARLPEVSVHTVEPAACDDTARSLVRGERVEAPPGSATICDALRAEMPGRLPFEILRRLAGPGLSVSDDDVRAAMRFAFCHLKIVLEPSGAAALAAVLAGKAATAGRTTVVVLSGGNVDPELYSAVQAEPT